MKSSSLLALGLPIAVSAAATPTPANSAASSCPTKSYTKGTFAVLHFNNIPGRFSLQGRMDPAISPGNISEHSHGVMGGDGFATTIEGDQLLHSNCTNAVVADDMSNYWVPTAVFQSPKNGSLTRVPLYYMNVYYKFEATHDKKIEAFPPGLKMVVGNPTLRDPPKAGGSLQLDPSFGESNPIQPVQWICPKLDNDAPRYPADSDGHKGGMPDPNDRGAGAGFPVAECDGLYSPLRQDVHFPSCRDPNVSIDDHKNNMKWPNMTWGSDGTLHRDCGDGFIHHPALTYEVYYNTPLFKDEWDHDGETQPFLLTNGDCTGYGSHGDFVAGWVSETLQTIIDTCDAGDAGMEQCPCLPGGLNKDQCDFDDRNNVAPGPPRDGWFSKLPGDNPLTGWYCSE